MSKVSEEHNAAGWCWAGTGTRAVAAGGHQDRRGQGGKGTRRDDSGFGGSRNGNELETASWAGGVERNKNEIPQKEELVIHSSVKLK